MDSIYSRKRIKIPRVKGFYTNNKNAKKFFSIFIIIIISVVTFYSLFKTVNPVFESLCIEKARSIGTYIINDASNIVLDNIDYKDMISIQKDEKGNVLKTDVVLINKIASDIALEAEKQFMELKEEEIKIPIGALTGNRLLAGSGPGMNIKVIPTGNILTEIKNEFVAQGINQTMYRIYLELTCKVSIVTQYKTIYDEVVNQVLLVETVIVGEVPETYYNIEGMGQDVVTDVLN